MSNPKTEAASVSMGASWHHHHPERMEIVQPRVARNELPWGGWPNTPTLKGLHHSGITRPAVLARCTRLHLGPIGVLMTKPLPGIVRNITVSAPNELHRLIAK